MKKMDGKSLDIEKKNISKLKSFFSEHKDEFLQVFPEVDAEGKIDVERLQLILGENVEDEEERYSFNWNGKRDAIRISQTPTTGTLRPDVKNSKFGGGYKQYLYRG